VLESKIEDLSAKQAYFETIAARLEALELRKNPSIQVRADVINRTFQRNRRIAGIAVETMFPQYPGRCDICCTCQRLLHVTIAFC
jgi:hypothetical protein